MLDDVLLALLGGRDSSAWELMRRHDEIFGSARRMDIVRVMASVTRLERAGFLRVDTAVPARMASSNRRTCSLTAAGRQRQRTWLCALPPDVSIEDVYVRGMLAVESADEATFDMFIRSGLAVTRARMHALADDVAGAAAVTRAKAAFERETVRALALWLHQLPDHRMPRSAAG
ncbi:PadR family transcriptional regulator [Dactylosporangium sp. NPDC049742]|uniref:PadR family transcriptional regulator n=1 Tax=Dactylosporangium sp. NPDC049742 TaxID=3154737 RepID=UPI0034401C1F